MSTAQHIKNNEWQVTLDDGVPMRVAVAATNNTQEAAIAAAEEAINPPQSVLEARAAADRRSAVITAIDSHVEETAKARDYNDAAALAGYVNSTVTAWADEAQAFVAWRDDVWQTAFAMLDEVQAGERAAPTPAEAVGELPEITWPS